MTAEPAREPKRMRPRRVAADEAHAWARHLKLGNPYGKSVLAALTLYVNGDGVCFVSIEQVADDTELSADTVRRRLGWLEEIGAIVRLPQWIDENGRRNGEGRGKRTTDEIRLLLDADVDEIERKADGRGGDEPREISPRPQQGLNPTSCDVSPGPQQGLADEVSPRSALGQPLQCCEGLNSESLSSTLSESEESPPTPPLGGCADVDDGWKDFERDWHEPILRQSLARQVWSALTADERLLVRKAARGYVAWRKGQKKPPNAINAHTFLKEREAWERFAALAPAEPPKPLPRTSLSIESAEWSALTLCYAIARRAPPQLRDGRHEFVGALPTGADALAALRHLNDRGEIERSDWVIVATNTPPFVAWCERVKEWLGRWPEEQRIWLDRDGNVVRSAQEAHCEPGRLPDHKNGLFVPRTATGFPPPKASKQTTGRPARRREARCGFWGSTKNEGNR